MTAAGEVPGTTLRVNDSLEGFTEPRKAIIFIVIVYHSKEIHSG